MMSPNLVSCLPRQRFGRQGRIPMLTKTCPVHLGFERQSKRWLFLHRNMFSLQTVRSPKSRMFMDVGQEFPTMSDPGITGLPESLCMGSLGQISLETPALHP